jgi:hypothetical protein
VGLPSVELASLTSSNDFYGVGHGGGPVEALSKGIPNQRPRGGMVPTSPRAYLSKEGSTLLGGDAPLEDP